MKPILCLDFDGVIHSYTSGWQGADVISDPPTEGAFDFILEASKEFKIVIHSSRLAYSGASHAIAMWFKEHGGEVAFFNCELSSEKPPAFVTIDDRAITFDGVWPSIQTLKEFKPWNKKGDSK